MTRSRSLPFLAAAGLIGCLMATPALAGDKGRNTLLGAGVGAAAGAVMSKGDPMATIGGAAVGGLIGNIATSGKRDRYGNHHHHYRHAPPPRHVKHRHRHRGHR